MEAILDAPIVIDVRRISRKNYTHNVNAQFAKYIDRYDVIPCAPPAVYTMRDDLFPTSYAMIPKETTKNRCCVHIFGYQFKMKLM